MVLKVKSTTRKTILFLAVFMMIVNIICSTFQIPTVIRYLSDIMVLLIFLMLMRYFKELIKFKGARLTLVVTGLFLIWTFIGYIVTLYSPFQYFWGLRNIARFLVVFFATTLFFRETEAIRIRKILGILYVVNFIVCIYQYAIQGYWADEIGGIFRLGEKGGNTGLLLLICIVTIYSFTEYLNKKMHLLTFLLIAASSMVIAAIAELKVYFILFVLIIFLSLILNRVSGRTIFVVIVSCLGILVGVRILGEIAPESLEILNIEGILEYAGGTSHGYSSSDDLSRMRFVAQINDKFFAPNSSERILGYGLGSCDVSSISIFKSDFYQRYSYLNYTWLMSAILYLETGWIGLILYILFFASVIYSCYRFRKRDTQNTSIYNSGILIAIFCIIMIWYNASLRNDIAFFVYVVLALPFVYYKEYVASEKICIDKMESCLGGNK